MLPLSSSSFTERFVLGISKNSERGDLREIIVNGPRILTKPLETGPKGLRLRMVAVVLVISAPQSKLSPVKPSKKSKAWVVVPSIGAQDQDGAVY